MTMNIAKAQAYAHKGLTNMQRYVNGTKIGTEPFWDTVQVFEQIEHPTLGRCLIGQFFSDHQGGIVAYDVHFPIADVRPCTPLEIAEIMSQKYHDSVTGPFTVELHDFAYDFDSLPVRQSKPTTPEATNATSDSEKR